MMKRLCLIFGFVSLALPLLAQMQVSAALDSTRILLGDQVRLTYTIRQPNGAVLQPADYRGTLDSIPEVEIIKVEALDTIRLADPMLLRQSLLLTSFDSGTYVIPGVRFQSRSGGAVIAGQANVVYLSVSPVPLDTAALMPIKDIMEEPLKMSDWLPYVLYPLAGILGLALIIYLIKRMAKPKEIVEEKEVWIPAHVTAFGKLKELEEGQLWQQGKIKPYYTQISYITREYMENRYGFNALESVTDEIAPELTKQQNIDPELQEEVMLMLGITDMVKFAKWMPGEDSHRNVLRVAKEFVEKTRGSDLPPEEEAEGNEEETTNDLAQ